MASRRQCPQEAQPWHQPQEVSLPEQRCHRLLGQSLPEQLCHRPLVQPLPGQLRRRVRWRGRPRYPPQGPGLPQQQLPVAEQAAYSSQA